jgi:hypothetical protein
MDESTLLPILSVQAFFFVGRSSTMLEVYEEVDAIDADSIGIGFSDAIDADDADSSSILPSSACGGSLANSTHSIAGISEDKKE